MASTYVNDLRLNEMATGDASGTWGEVTNTNLELIAEAFSYGTEAITTNADTHTTTIADGATDPGRSLYLKYTGTLDSACTITIGPNTVSKLWFIENATSGSQNIIISQGSGANVTIPAGETKVVYSDGAGSGAAITDAFANLKVSDAAQTNITSVGALDGGSITSNFGSIDVGSSAITTTGTVTGGTLAGTLSTAAQPNITSLGTLTTLTVDDITINGSTISDAGDLTLDVGGDILLDADSDGSVRFLDGGTEFAHHFLTSTNYVVQAPVSNGDIIFRGNDGGSSIDALTLDMSDAGTAIFNHNLVIPASIYHTGDTNTFFGFQSADTFTVNTNGSERMRIDSSGNVGIGTDSPDGNLEVVTSTVVSGASDTVNNVLIGLQSANRPTIILDTADTTYTNRTWNITNVGSIGSLVIGRNGLDVLNLKNDGKVGIGTSSPDKALTISASDSQVRLYDADGTNQFASFQSDNGITKITSRNNTSHGQITFQRYNGTTVLESMRIDEDGNVGIGTSSPADRFHVALDSSTTNAEVEVMRIEASSSGTPAVGFGPFIDFRGDRITGGVDSYGRLGFEADAMPSTQVDGAFVIQPAENGTYTERFRISSDGKVGIGETSPQNPLHVRSDSASGENIALQIDNNDTTAGNEISILFRSRVGTTNTDFKIAGIANAANDMDLVFQSDGQTERMRIDSSGNVGIGTSSPQAPLHARNGSSGVSSYTAGTRAIVEGTATTYLTIAAPATSVSGILFADPDDSDNGYIKYDHSQSGIMDFGTAGSMRMRINSSGNVGIGTASPSGSVHLTTTDSGGSDVYYVAQNTNASRIAGYKVLDESGNLQIHAYYDNGSNNAVLDLGAAGGIKQYIYNGGTVKAGFGVDLSGSSRELSLFHSSSGTDGNISFGKRAESGGAYTEAARITGAGRVGIGTSSPSSLLHVDGSFSGTAVTIHNTAGASSSDRGLDVETSTTGTTVQRWFNAGSELARINALGRLLIGGTSDRGAHVCVGGDSNTARVIPMTDNVGYVGEAAFRWQAIYAVTSTIQTSDEREKTEIKETTLGLDFIKDLKPVSYKWIDGEQLNKGKDKREHQGLIAQQVAETVEKHGIDKNTFGGLDIQKTEKYDDFHGMSYDQFVAPLIKAIQEQQAQIEALQSEINLLKGE